MASHIANKLSIQLYNAQTDQWRDITHAFEKLEFSAHNASAAFTGLGQAFENFGTVTGSFSLDRRDILTEMAELERQERWSNVWRCGFALWVIVALVAAWAGT